MIFTHNHCKPVLVRWQHRNSDTLSEDHRSLIEINRIKVLDRLNKKQQTRCCSCGSTGHCVRCSCVLSGQSGSYCTPSSLAILEYLVIALN